MYNAVTDPASHSAYISVQPAFHAYIPKPMFYTIRPPNRATNDLDFQLERTDHDFCNAVTVETLRARSKCSLLPLCSLEKSPLRHDACAQSRLLDE